MEVGMVVEEVDKHKVKVDKDLGVTKCTREPGGRAREVRETKTGAWFALTRWRYEDGRLLFRIPSKSKRNFCSDFFF